MERYTETELRKWYRNNVGDEFAGYEDEFILSAKRFCDTDADELPAILSDAESPDYEDEFPRAEAVIGDRYIPVEQISLDFLRGIFCGVVAGSVLPGEASLRKAAISGIIEVAFSVGKESRRLPSKCLPFYNYLVTAQYTYFDRIKFLFHHDKGFPMQAAIESFCQLEMEKDSDLDGTKLRETVQNIAMQLKDAGVISNVSEDRYIITF